MAYTSINSNPTVTGTGIADLVLGFITGVNIAWQSNLAPIRTLNGPKRVADIPKGKIQVQCLVTPTGGGSINELNSTATAEVVINNLQYNNTYHTGGQIGTVEFGEGLKSLSLTKIFSVFGECPIA